MAPKVSPNLLSGLASGSSSGLASGSSSGLPSGGAKSLPKVLSGPLIKERTTLKIGGKTLGEVVLQREADFDALPQILQETGGVPLVLGGGSNILADDKDLPFIIVTLPSTSKPLVVKESADSVWVKASAGLPLPALLAFAAKAGLSGLEGLAGIPGTVGGAIAMNAGSYGFETAAALCKATIFTPEHGLKEFLRSELNMEYRRFSCSATSGAAYFIIAEAEFKFTKSSSKEIKKVMKECLVKKASTQPLKAYSAGCAFCNPLPNVSAGKLLDECGFRGKELGGMMFSPLHANFLVNKGKGTFDEAVTLLEMAKEKVRETFEHELKLEIKIYS